MDNLYDRFDERARHFFAQLETGIDRTNPNKKELKRRFIAEVRRVLNLTSLDINELRQSFRIAHFAYRKILRRNGEAYIFHVIRSTLVLVWVCGEHRVFDIGCCHVLLQHDSYEETEDTWYAQTLIRSIVHLRLGNEVAQDVLHLTQTNGETDEEYLIGILTKAGWRALIAKIVERTDNVWTLDKNDPARSKRKLQDTARDFPKVFDRLIHLVQIEVGAGRLGKSWINVVQLLSGYLWYAVASKKHEFALT